MPHASELLLTKILATVGPSCATPAVLARLIEEGARVFRINFSHGSIDSFAAALAAVRAAGEVTGQHVAVLGDLSGPKIRVGQVREGGVDLEPGDVVEFQRQPILADRSANGHVVFSTNYPAMLDEVQPGERLLIDDGNLRLLVIDKAGSGDGVRLIASVRVGGRVTSSKGVNLPDNLSSALPSITEHDKRCVRWAVENKVDFLALSFVRRATDIKELRALVASHSPVGGAIPLIAKIEKPQALDDIDAIVQAADGVMVARGDLGVEMDLAQVPGIQKRLITITHDYGKPVIVATQMLQSMIDSAAPTRAEVSDVANAIYDGADAVMLSGETAVGRYPIQAVAFMARIARATQEDLQRSYAGGRPPRKLQETRYRTAALAHGVGVVVRDLDAKLVVTWSEAGGGARYLSQNRLLTPIVAAGSNPTALRRMNLLYGVLPLHMQRPESGDDFMRQIDRLIIERGWAEVGDAVVVVKGEPLGTPGVTNELLIHYVGDVCRVR